MKKVLPIGVETQRPGESPKKPQDSENGGDDRAFDCDSDEARENVAKPFTTSPQQHEDGESEEEWCNRTESALDSDSGNV